MEIRRVNKYVYDIFLGTQWDGWSRIRKGRSSTFVMQGNKLSYALLKQLDAVLNPSLHLKPGNHFNLVNA